MLIEGDLRLMTAIAVHSYKGGTGKTTVGVNLALAYARKGKNTVIIDGDFHAPSLNKFLPLSNSNESIKYINDYLAKDCELEDIMHPTTYENLHVVYADPNPVFGEGVLSLDKHWHRRALQRLMKANKKLKDVLKKEIIIIDNTPGMTLFSVNSLYVADIALLVLRPTNYGVEGTEFLIQNLYKMLGKKKRKDYVLYNQVPHGYDSTTFEKWDQSFEKLGVSVIGKITCSCPVALCMSKGKNIFPPEDPFSQEIAELGERLLGIPVYNK